MGGVVVFYLRLLLLLMFGGIVEILAVYCCSLVTLGFRFI